MLRRFGLGMGLGLLRRRSVAARLADSLALTASGAGISVSTLNADGTYTVTTTASSTINSFVSHASSISGDILAEVEIVTHQSGAWFGIDGAAPASRGYTVMDEVGVPDFGFGATKVNAYKNGVGVATNRAFTGKLYLERVGSTFNIRAGTSWEAAKGAAAIITTTAVDALARYFQLGINTAGIVISWKVRVVPHPG